MIHQYTCTGFKSLPTMGLDCRPGQKINCEAGSERDRILRTMVGKGFTGPVYLPSGADKAAEEAAAKAAAQERARQEGLLAEALETSREASAGLQRLQSELDEARNTNDSLRRRLADALEEKGDLAERVEALEAEAEQLRTELGAKGKTSVETVASPAPIAEPPVAAAEGGAKGHEDVVAGGSRRRPRKKDA